MSEGLPPPQRSALPPEQKPIPQTPERSPLLQRLENFIPNKQRELMTKYGDYPLIAGRLMGIGYVLYGLLAKSPNEIIEGVGWIALTQAADKIRETPHIKKWTTGQPKDAPSEQSEPIHQNTDNSQPTHGYKDGYSSTNMPESNRNL